MSCMGYSKGSPISDCQRVKKFSFPNCFILRVVSSLTGSPIFPVLLEPVISAR
jgi:hypothetical protein